MPKTRITLATIHKQMKQLATKDQLAHLATKDQLAKLATKDELANLATKDQLANLATKDLLTNLATKDELANLATKDQLANLATKDQLTNLATKDELANLATKDQLANLATEDLLTNLATKDELANLAAKIDALSIVFQTEFQRVNEKLDEHTQELKDLRARVDTLHGLMENLLVRTERLEQEYTMITAGLKRLETRFDDLEAARLRQRIEALEKRVTALESVHN
jgi:hypothetical protein